jgi:hypothetical protein
VVLEQLVGRNVDADIGAVMEDDAFGLHLHDALVDVMLFHLEVGDAIAEQAARFRPTFVEMDLVAGACELLRAGKTGGA